MAVTAGQDTAPEAPERPAVLGAGSIGTAWSIVHAMAGLTVRLHDSDAARLAAAQAEIADRLADLAAAGLLAEPVEAVLARVQPAASLAALLEGATWVQECVPEDLALKRDLLGRLDALAAPGVVLASSSSFIPPSALAEHLAGRARMLVVHPGNPPYLLRIAELVPAPFTSAPTLERADRLMRRVGLAPVLVAREVEGFVFNRLQGALLREAYCLVRDGVIGVADLDRLVRDGLGLRWAVVGPFETVDLNSRGGIAAHAARMGPAYARMGAERGQDDPWTPELVARVTAERRAALPLAAWAERVAWRDRALMAVLRHRPAVPDGEAGH